jgi:hypothetical protein
MSRRTVALMSGAASLVSAVAWAAVAWLNLRYGGTITTALFVTVILTATAAVWLVLRRRWWRILAACLGGLLLTALAVLAWWAPIFDRHVRLRRRLHLPVRVRRHHLAAGPRLPPARGQPVWLTLRV